MSAPDQYAVFGNPIAQSKSPIIHKAFAEETGQSIEYRAQLVDVDGFKKAADEFFHNGGKGLNITSPFKGDAYQYATILTPRARRAAAVNTLALQENGVVLGDTTDGVGIVSDITKNLGWTISGKNILLLGAGGAARGVLEAFLGENPASICIANRTASKAQALAKGYADLGQISGMGMDELENSGPYDLVISATSAGLVGESVALPANIIGVNSCAYDMIYRAEPTPFMQWAGDLGARTSDGLGMLVGQAAESFKVWRGLSPATRDIILDLRDSL